MSLENDIFNNPLEAFPEFIDEPIPATPAQQQTAVSEPVVSEPVEDASATVESATAPEPAAAEPAPAEPKRQNKYIPSYASANYIDPLETIEEIDLGTLSKGTEISFEEDAPVIQEPDSTISFFEKANFTLGKFEYEDVAVKPGAELYDIDDSVPDAVPETEEVSIDDFLSDAGSGTEEIDLDAFLGDSGFSDSPQAPSAPSAGATEEISLDDFGVDFGGFDASAIDAFAASTKQEKSDIENAPAIEMELEFDDDFVLETKANPEDDIDFDFEALMAGESIEIPQQTGSSGDELLDNFDNIFDNIVDESAPAAAAAGGEIEFDPSAIEEVSLDDFGLGSGASTPPPAESDSEKVSEQQIVFDEVSEFDDLLSSFSDDTHVEVADNRISNDEKNGPREYNIIVVLDEDEEPAVAAPMPVAEEASEEEDYEISIFADEKEAENYRNHLSGPVQEASFSISAPGEFHGSDSVSTDSFEDISLDDFGVSFEDETPAEPQAESEALDSAEIPATEEVLEVPQEEIEEEPQDETPDELAVTEGIPENLDLPDIDDIVIPEEEMSDIEEESDVGIIMEEESDFVTECEDTTIDDKKIVELSEDCVYNGDNTEYTPDMIDGYNEEISDTMDSMNEGLLEKIVSELSVLRNEMQTLRDEVQTLKGGEPAAFETEAAPAVQEDEFALPEDSEAVPESPVSEEDIPLPEVDPLAAPQEAGGFFSGDDDDETIALSGDELNNILNSADFTQEDGSDFVMETPEGSIPTEGLDDFAKEPPVEESVTETEDVAADAFDIDFDEPVVETEGAPAEEAETPVVEESPEIEDVPVDDFMMDEPVAEETVSEEPVVEEVVSEEPVFEETAEVPAEDFDTDLPSLKDESAPAAEDTPATDDFSLDDFDIPEPSVDEESIVDIDIDEPEEPKAEEFSLDEFDIPEPTVDESPIVDIDIDEPSAEIPSDEPVVEETPVIEESAEDADFYANSDSPAISEDDMSSLDIQENLEEPVLDDIDFGVDEPQADDIDIPTGESLVVDSSSTDFLEEEDPTLDEQLTSEKVDYLNEEASVDDLGALPEIEEVPAVEGMEDSLEADTLATSEDETPADDVFSSQWDSIPEPAAEPAFEDTPVEEETVEAAKSFDDPVSFDIDDVAEPAVETIEDTPAEDFSLDEPIDDIPSDEPVIEETPAETDSFDAIADYEAPVEDEPVPEPAVETEPALDNDIKQEVKSVLKYMDQLLENLPEDKIAEFAQSEHFETYKKLFNELGLV